MYTCYVIMCTHVLFHVYTCYIIMCTHAMLSCVHMLFHHVYNSPRCLYRYWVHYCRAEGLTRSHDMARRILMYLFYATPMYKGRPASCLRIIHRSMMAGTHRFASGAVLACFKDLLDILNDEHTGAEATKWLTDKGAGTASTKFLAAFEAGIRKLALVGSRAFPRGSIASRAAWEKVEAWMKRQCYFFIARHHLGKENLKAYNDFRWEDHVLRERLTKTFDKRHLPVSDGRQKVNFPRNSCPTPASWDDGTVPVRRELLPAAVDSSAADNTGALEWDSDAEVWIEACVNMTCRMCAHAL